jgi:hypothetical protein
MGSQQTLHEMRELLRCGVLIPLPKSNKSDKEKWDAAFKAADDAAANRKAQATVPKVDVYEGSLQDNERNGKGTMKYANGDVYVGLWLEDKRNGRGTMTYINGNVYQGNWEADKMKGVGKFTHHSPDTKQDFDWKFSGEFKNDVAVCGTLTYKENNIWTQIYTNKWKPMDIKEAIPVALQINSKKSGVDPNSDNLSDPNPQETQRKNSKQYDDEAARNDAKEEQYRRNHNPGIIV